LKNNSNVLLGREKPEGVYTFDEVIALGKGKISDEEVDKNITASHRTMSLPSSIHQEQQVTKRRDSHSEKLGLQHVSGFQFHLDEEGAGIGTARNPSCAPSPMSCFRRTSDYHVGALQQGGILVFAESFDKIPKICWKSGPMSSSVFHAYGKKFTIQQNQSFPGKIRQRSPFFNWAMKLGEKYSEAMASASRMGQVDLLQFAAANILVFNKIKKTADWITWFSAYRRRETLQRCLCVYTLIGYSVK